MQSHGVELLKRDSIIPDPNQPRKVFNEEALWELAKSIESSGLLQPISVRPKRGDSEPQYIIIAGERRWRATGLLGWTHIEAIVRDLPDGEAARLQLLENIVRRDLNPVEEARAYQRFMDERYSLQEIAQTVGLAAAQISWRLQMLNARDDVLHLVATGQLKPSIAHALSKLSADGQARALRAINSDRLTYNEVLALCQRIQAEECQIDMFPETQVTSDQRRAATCFDDSLDRMSRVLHRLLEMERECPGALGEALAVQNIVAEAKVDEMVRGLNRVKRAIQNHRMYQLAEAV